jgi:hypothetical protein
VTGARLAECWAGDLTLADGAEPFAEAAVDPQWELAGCVEPHAYELWLDGAVWSTGYTILCAAAIRALPHGGIAQITSPRAGRALGEAAG